MDLTKMSDEKKDKDEKKEQEFPDEWTEHIEKIVEELFKRNPNKQKH